MSFQGDVAGIGLGELLQGLSRGGRDGVLTLYGDDATSCIGLHRGQLYFLAGPDEEEDLWRERSLNAFVDDPDPNCESARREAIARASRLETIYRMLEAPGLHFRFEQGPLPLPPNYHGPASSTISIDGQAAEPAFDPAHSPWGPGVTVEFLLLEHARMSDEASDGVAATLSAYDIPRSLDTAAEADPATRDFLAQCDGISTIQEIADRLGWPFSQCRNTVASQVEAGHLRMAEPRELLAGAQRELELGRIGRAAERLSGWITSSPPGPPPLGDADLLIGEWEAGRLGHILHALTPRHGRALLRKLDRVHIDTRAARERWQALQDAHRSDTITWLHGVALRLVATEEPEARTFHDLLALARQFQENGLEKRTRTLLRLASGHLPSRPRVRIELGKRMIDSGLEDEGTRWLLDTAHELIEAGDPASALAPIRYVLRAVPGHGEAGSLEVHAQTLCANRKKRKVVVAVSLSLGVLLSLAALVQYRKIRKVEDWLVQVQAYVGEPAVALEKLQEAFGDDPPPRIAEARERLFALQRESKRRAQEKWREVYKEAEDAARFGDPLLGLRRTMELGPPPGTDPGTESFNERQDLLGILADRLGKQSDALDLPASMSVEELNQEQRLIDLLRTILDEIPEEGTAPEIANFRFHIEELLESILTRRDARAEERALLSAKEKDQKADILLATARAHATAGDLDRALAAYDRLLATDESLRTLPSLKEEIQSVQRHRDGLTRATELAKEGEHEAAANALLEVCPRPLEHLLPYRVDTRPEGCSVTTADGHVHTTPFVAKSAIGEVVEFTFSEPGFAKRTVRLDRPRDIFLDLQRIPDRSWADDHRIEAIP
ncbi:MAG TPA: DUF4388 domain-containing protein, partial [Planctomycetes bacterium]|nr:DUF4388 domain-containing protein [Planctomycetota bacterium]